MSISLYDLLKRDVKRMIVGIGKNSQGNIHPLIMNEVEKCIIELVLRETGYNFVLAAKMLGISRSTLYRKLDSMGLSKEI